MSDDAVRHWVAASLEFQAASLRELEAETVPGIDAAACLTGMALERQCRQQLGHLTTTWRSRWLEPHREMVSAHERLVRRVLRRARRRVAAFTPEAREEAKRRIGVRLAIVGKGGAGKSMVAGSLSRLLARSGRRVLSVDLDTTPGLAYSLGMPDAPAGIPDEALESESGSPPRLASGLSPNVVIERFTTAGPDGIRYVGLGKVGDGDGEALRRSAGPVMQLLFNVGSGHTDVVADLEAGPRPPSQGLHAFADLVVVVFTPMWKSAIAARRVRAAAGTVPAMVVLNRWEGQRDYAGLSPAVRIPDDPAVAEAERLGVAPCDHDPESPAMRAIGELAGLVSSTSWRQP